MSTPNMIWTPEAEKNLLMCLWCNNTGPKIKISSTKWQQITKDFAEVQGQRVGTSALQTRVSQMKKDYVPIIKEPSPEAESGDPQPDEDSHSQDVAGPEATSSNTTQPKQNAPHQLLVGGGEIPRVVTLQYPEYTSVYQLSSFHPGRHPGNPCPEHHQNQMARHDYQYTVRTQNVAVSQGAMGYADTSNYDPRILEDRGGSQYTYPPLM